MLALLGSAGVAAALIGSVLLVVRGIGVARGGEGQIRAPARLVLAGAIVAMAAMEIALLSDDFSLAYVANHHATATPFPFDVATAWAALEGSIILWGLVLAVFTWVVARRSLDRLGAAALAVMGGVGVFFFGLMLGPANPFRTISGGVPTDGPGPNPLLQNHPLVAFHPPMLYLGYVGFTIPFAFAVAALITGRFGEGWLADVRLYDACRHSYASMAVSRHGLTLPQIGAQLGHSQPATTARYAHLHQDVAKQHATVIGGSIATALRQRVRR